MEVEPSPITKIFIQRDYAYGTGVRFCEDVPPELSGKVSLWLKNMVDCNSISTRLNHQCTRKLWNM